MTDEGRAQVQDTEASAADIQEQLRAVRDEADDDSPRFHLPYEVSEADALEQLRGIPADDDDRR